MVEKKHGKPRLVYLGPISEQEGFSGFLGGKETPQGLGMESIPELMSEKQEP